MSDLREIFLQPECCADEHSGRLWCEDDAPVDCEDDDGNEIPWTRYVRADLHDSLAAENAALKAQLAYAASTGDECAIEVESLRKDAERYRFIKQWARRLDITGYSLTNNEHFEPRIDEAMAIASQPSSADVERRPCTCHPDDNPPIPCPRMYALQDCRRAAALGVLLLWLLT